MASLRPVAVVAGGVREVVAPDSAVVDAVLFPAGAAPLAPPAGAVRLYVKADGALYQKDATGAETLVG